jgi:hypothetical protein
LASTKEENEWLDRAIAAMIAAARKVALANSPLMNTPVGRLTDSQWGWIVTAAIFAWVSVRVQQAIAEGLDQEQAVRTTGLTPSPCDVAVVTSIMPKLAETAGIDWSLPLQAWSKDMMTNFLMLAWKLINESECARDRGPGKILHASKPPPDWKEGDDISDVPLGR